MSRKDKEALRKEMEGAESGGEDSDDDDGEGGGKRKYNPFEEEIEGY